MANDAAPITRIVAAITVTVVRFFHWLDLTNWHKYFNSICVYGNEKPACALVAFWSFVDWIQYTFDTESSTQINMKTTSNRFSAWSLILISDRITSLSTHEQGKHPKVLLLDEWFRLKISIRKQVWQRSAAVIFFHFAGQNLLPVESGRADNEQLAASWPSAFGRLFVRD